MKPSLEEQALWVLAKKHIHVFRMINIDNVISAYKRLYPEMEEDAVVELAYECWPIITHELDDILIPQINKALVEILPFAAGVVKQELAE